MELSDKNQFFSPTESVNEYELKNFGKFDDAKVMMPKGAVILSATYQDGRIFIYALVRPDEPKEERNFILVSTGEKLNWLNKCKFIATVILDRALHIFEVVDK